MCFRWLSKRIKKTACPLTAGLHPNIVEEFNTRDILSRNLRTFKFLNKSYEIL